MADLWSFWMEFLVTMEMNLQKSTRDIFIFRLRMFLLKSGTAAVQIRIFHHQNVVILPVTHGHALIQLYNGGDLGHDMFHITGLLSDGQIDCH